MAVFWVLAGLMTVLALAFVLVPLLRIRAPGGPSAMEANLEVLRGQRRELEADVAAGLVPANARGESLEELVQRAEADLAEPASAVVADRKRPWVAAA
ncbi:MAG: c-type cytochrome biogenesis protein CcmI, partial [Burkholderiales bacterium]|nr:c-type cytochrome biogenesis protein CcmI [Burkholderiales bacterium]